MGMFIHLHAGSWCNLSSLIAFHPVLWERVSHQNSPVWLHCLALTSRDLFSLLLSSALKLQVCTTATQGFQPRYSHLVGKQFNDRAVFPLSFVFVSSVLKTSIPTVTHFLQQRHTSPEGHTSQPFQIVPLPQHLNIWTYGSPSYSNNHSRFTYLLTYLFWWDRVSLVTLVAWEFTL